MNIELISFKLCPFVQRAIIVLKKQNINYDITYINIMDPPDWFKKVSPLGQVPLLKIDNEAIFEATVISELINDISPKSLHPTNHIEKAKNRSWIEFSSNILMDLFKIISATNKENFEQEKNNLFNKLTYLEKIKNNNTFFNDNDFLIIDAAYAPIFMRLNWLNKLTNNLFSINALFKLNSWSNHLLNDSDVKTSVVEGLEGMYRNMIMAKNGYLSTQLIEQA